MADDAGWRVKLYNLDNEGQWSDQGTGHVSCGYVDRLGGTALVVDDEVVKQGKLLEVRIVEDDIYTRQGDTIITWTEPSSNADLALSFEDTEGWNRIWEDVCKVQGRAAVQAWSFILYPSSFILHPASYLCCVLLTLHSAII